MMNIILKKEDTMTTTKLILIRHGESTWNKENKFTGWTDIDLSEEGVLECGSAAKQLQNFHFDIAYTSRLIRAWRTLDIIAEELGRHALKKVRRKALNERHYGELQGMDKDEARRRFGEEQVTLWRRGFHDRPPGGESLADTRERVLLFFKKEVLPSLFEGKNILIVAHGNSLRALIMYLERLDERQVQELEVPTGRARFYLFETLVFTVS